MTSFFDDGQGPYPEGWGEPEIRLWESEPQTYRAFYDSEQEWHELQVQFERGWLVRQDVDSEGNYERLSLSKNEREAARDEFYRMTGTLPSSFDWDEYREYLEAFDSGSL